MRRQCGQTLAEMALVLPLVALLICGVIGLARLANVNEALHNACREGARWSAIPDASTGELPAASDVVNRVVQFAADDGIALPSGDVQVSQVDLPQGGVDTWFSQVQIVNFKFYFVPSLLSALVPSVTLAPEAEMRNETN